MKKALFFIGFITMGLTAFSQVSKDELELIRSILNSERKVFFAQNMELSTDQFNQFWPIYESYESDSKVLMDESIDQMKTLINDSEKISDEELDVIQKTTFKRRKKILSLQKKYYGIMKKELGTKAASRFIQIDRFVDANVKAQLFGEMPLIKAKK